VDLEKRQWILKCANGFEEKWRIGPEVIKACGEGGFFLSWHHFIAEAISPVRSENKNKEQKPTTPAHSE